MDPVPRRRSQVAQRPTGYDVGQEALASAMHDEVVCRVDAELAAAAPAGGKIDAAPLTFRPYVALWLEEPPAAAAARRARTGEPFRTEAYNGKRWREEDMVALVALGWGPREMYAMKATFITLILDDGADPHVIETRVTHTKRSRSAFDGYNRGRQWELTCAEVAKLRLARRAEDLEVPIAVGAAPLVTVGATTGDASGSGLRRRVSNPRPGG